MFTYQSRKSLHQMFTLTLIVMAFTVMVMAGSVCPAFCASNTILEAVNTVTNQIYTIARSIVVPICIVALAFAGFQFLVGGNQGAEKARKVVFGCVGAICFVVFAPMVVKTIASAVSSEGTGGMDRYNPLKS